jgi:hypothetical protein
VVLTLQDIKVNGCSCVAKTHNTGVKMVNEFTEDMKKKQKVFNNNNKNYL